MRILSLALLLMLPLAASAHPDHAPHWHGSDSLGFVVLAAIAAGSLRLSRGIANKRGA